jgi:carboxylesterase type B
VNLHLTNLSPLPLHPTGLQYRRTAAYAGDEVFIAGRRLTCATWAANSVPAYCYRFNARPSGIPRHIGVTHFQEVAFVFNNVNGLGYAVNPFLNKSQSYFELSKLMSCSWASFVHDLDPNSFRGAAVGKAIAGQAAPWPKYGNGSAAMNIVWDANVTSFAEPDTFRAAGIDLINKNSLLYLR